MTRARWCKTGGRPIWTATRDKCNCAGYPFPHRKGGGACESSPYSDFHRALQHGADMAEAMQQLSVNALESKFPLESLP